MSYPGRGGKPFTIENLRADEACSEGMAFVTPLIEAGKDVALHLQANGYIEWLCWAIANGYDCESAWHNMDDSGTSFVWDILGRVAATAGVWGVATAGDRGKATAGDWGVATAGDRGKATAGDWGVATAGDRGKATAGDWGVATAGYKGHATADFGGLARAGLGGVIALLWWDGGIYRLRAAEVDGENIKANVFYKLDRNGNFVEAGE